MSWKYREPDYDDYSSEEDYEEAMEAYDYAYDQYIDECEERGAMERASR